MQKIDYIRNYISHRLELWIHYHNHKESMANAGFLVQISLFGAIITKSIWPPEWVAKVISLPALATFSVYALMWFLIHYYTRWQLVNKRISAFYVAGFDSALRKTLTVECSSLDINACRYEATKPRRFRNALSSVIYLPKGYVRMDASVSGLPKFLADEVRLRFEKGSGAETLEILVTYTSILLLFLVGIKVFLG